ncbi:MAG: hypothetical protein HQL54_09915 [Magnetococcales bacterium]|nr:hypothetical protein [Magnetococcales bacterium]
MKSLSLRRLFPVLMALLFAVSSGSVIAKEPPVLMLMQVKGTIEYSKNGTKWKKVRRNKFLFSGYQLRSGADGSGTLVNQSTSMSRQLGANTVIKVAPEGAQLVSGDLGEPAKADSSLVSNLNNRFSKAQRYTTVRRSVNKKGSIKLSTAKQITLSNTYPELVWQNVGEEYSYRLTIDGDQTFTIDSGSNDIIRFKLSGLSSGEHDYRVEVIKGEEVIYAPRKDATLTWLSSDEEAKLLASVKAVKDVAPGDDFLMAAHMEEKGLAVAAMDLYRKYFDENPDDLDMRPLLIKAYHDLKLSTLKKQEAIRYNEMLNAEG